MKRFHVFFLGIYQTTPMGTLGVFKASLQAARSATGSGWGSASEISSAGPCTSPMSASWASIATSISIDPAIALAVSKSAQDSMNASLQASSSALPIAWDQGLGCKQQRVIKSASTSVPIERRTFDQASAEAMCRSQRCSASFSGSWRALW